MNYFNTNNINKTKYSHTYNKYNPINLEVNKFKNII
jgi:hypothetical protein